jgi:uncharacterized protein with PQ loop repeat
MIIGLIEMQSHSSRSCLVARWVLFGVVIAALISTLLLLPALLHLSVEGMRAGIIATTASAVICAMAAVLYQIAGRLRFWVIVFALSVASLPLAMTLGKPIFLNAPIVWVGVAALGLLSAWVLLAYGLHSLHRRRQ